MLSNAVEGYPSNRRQSTNFNWAACRKIPTEVRTPTLVASRVNVSLQTHCSAPVGNGLSDLFNCRRGDRSAATTSHQVLAGDAPPGIASLSSEDRRWTNT